VSERKDACSVERSELLTATGHISIIPSDFWLVTGNTSKSNSDHTWTLQRAKIVSKVSRYLFGLLFGVPYDTMEAHVNVRTFFPIRVTQPWW
jgi:hypothetical protein